MSNKIIQHSFSNKPVKSLTIAAHFDDVEFMAYSPITKCLQSKTDGFGAVVVTDGSGSPRTGKYANITDPEMVQLRIQEQTEAARLGQYSQMIMLMQPSSVVKAVDNSLVAELAKIIKNIKPDVLYTHNPFDKHPTHIAVCKSVVAAVKSLSPIDRPKQFVGCEVWRALDWIADSDKIPMDTSYDHEFARKLFGAFPSQIEGGKNYGEACLGRFTANSTFYDSHGVDKYTSLSYGIDMSSLMGDTTLTQFAQIHLDKLAKSVLDNYK